MDQAPLSSCARHFGLSCVFFACRHETTRSRLMSAALHRLMASLVQAARCSAVGLNSADAAVGSTMKSRLEGCKHAGANLGHDSLFFFGARAVIYDARFCRAPAGAL